MCSVMNVKIIMLPPFFFVLLFSSSILYLKGEMVYYNFFLDPYSAERKMALYQGFPFPEIFLSSDDVNFT